jgi:hypothetical protein
MTTGFLPILLIFFPLSAVGGPAGVCSGKSLFCNCRWRLVSGLLARTLSWLYHTWQIISPPTFCFLASESVIRPLEVESMLTPKAARTLGMSVCGL